MSSTPASTVKANPFWDWSNGVYDLEGVKERLLRLQDDFGFDVNIMLWCAWRASEGETLDMAAIKQAEQTVSDWSEGVIEPLREARRNAKNGPPAFYEQIKTVELEAEHLEQNILFDLSGRANPITDEEKLAAANQNLALYASLIDAPRRQGFSTALLRELIDHQFAGTGVR